MLYILVILHYLKFTFFSIGDYQKHGGLVVKLSLIFLLAYFATHVFTQVDSTEKILAC